MENSRNSHSTGGEISKSVGTGRGTCYWYSYWYRYFYQFWYFGRSSTRQAKFLYFQAFGTSIIADWVLGPVLVPVPAIPVHFGTGYRLLTPIPAYSPEEAKSSGEATSILSDDFMNRKQLNSMKVLTSIALSVVQRLDIVVLIERSLLIKQDTNMTK